MDELGESATGFMYRGLKIDIHTIGSDKEGWRGRGIVCLAPGDRIALEPTSPMPTRASAHEAAANAARKYIDRAGR